MGLLLVLLVATLPVVLGQRTLMATAVPGKIAVDEPLDVLHGRARDAVDAPAWNPHGGLGAPLLPASSGLFSPLELPRLTWPRSRIAHDGTYLLRLLLAALGAGALALWLGASPPGAFAAGVVFGLCGHLTHNIHFARMDAEVLLPWAWLAADALARRHAPWRTAGFAVVAFAVAITGSLGSIVVVAATTALFGLARADTWGAFGLGRVAVAGAAPVLLAAPAWLASLDVAREVGPPWGADPGFAHTFACGVGLFALIAAGTAIARRRRGQAGLHLLLIALGLLGIATSVVPAPGSTHLAAAGALALALLCATGIQQLMHLPVGALALVLITGELVLRAPAGAPVEGPPFAAPAFVDALPRKRTGAFRILGVDDVLSPARSVALGIDDLRAPPGRWPARLALLLDNTLGGTTFSVAVDPPDGAVDPRDPRLARWLDLLNVRYLALPASAAAPDLEVAFVDDDVALYERPDAVRRAFMPRRVVAVDDAEEALSRMQAPGFDPLEVAFVEGDVADGATDREDGGFVRVVDRPAATDLSLGVQTRRPGYVIASVQPWPGLRAELSRRTSRGVEITTPEVRPANVTMCAIPVPAGRSRLRIYHEPAHAVLGVLLQVAGVFVLAGAATLALRANPARNR